MARIWGEGLTASSDGQFFPAGGTGEAMYLVNAWLTARSPASRPAPISPTSSHRSPYAPSRPPPTRLRSPSGSNRWRTMARPSTVSWVTRPAEGCASIMPPLVHCCAIPCRAMDTGGFTDHVFAACSILGYTFAPRIRDLPDKRLYAFEPNAASRSVRPLIAARVRTDLTLRNWPDLLRLTASMSLGTVVPSVILRKLALGRCPRTDGGQRLVTRGRTSWPPRLTRGRPRRALAVPASRWIAAADLQRRTRMGLNKGEAHHALKRAISLGRRGEIRDHSSEGQHHRMAGLNLLAAAVIHRNTRQLGRIVGELAAAGQPPDPANDFGRGRAFRAGWGPGRADPAGRIPGFRSGGRLSDREVGWLLSAAGDRQRVAGRAASCGGRSTAGAKSQRSMRMLRSRTDP